MAGILPLELRAGEPANPPQAKHNILFIAVDDLKPLLGCYGNPEIKTPNIDRLAARGTVFFNNHCQQAVCGPTRASLMTGMYPDHTGVWDLKTRMREVHPDILTLPQYLIQHGYETTSLGKTFDNRCVDSNGDKPSWSIPRDTEKIEIADVKGMVRGYRSEATKAAIALGEAALAGKTFADEVEKKKALKGVAGARVAPATECVDAPDDAFFDGALADAGCRQLGKLAASKRPFFLSVGFLKPHLPFVAPKKYWDLYDRSRISVHPFQSHAKNSPEIAYHSFGELRGYSDIPDLGEVSPDQQKELIHGYMACVSYVDAQIGRLLDKIGELGIADNTIICLWGDHGWHLGDHGLWCKHSTFENATRAPLIVSAPGKSGGQRTDSISGFIDVFPTLCELAGVPVPRHLDGTSLVPLMENPGNSVREDILSQYPRTIDDKPVMGYALRSGRYRYVKWLQLDYRKGERSGLLVATELYDYEKDPLEKVSEAGNEKYKEVVLHFESRFKKMNVAQHKGVYGAGPKDPS